MSDPNIIYDITSTDAPAGILAVILSIGFPTAILFFGIVALRRSFHRIGVVISLSGISGLVFGIGSLFVDTSAGYRDQIAKNEYVETRGTISDLTNSTLVAGNPVATFKVSEQVFEYGRGSINYDLDRRPLRNGLTIVIWHHEGRILKIFRAA